MNEPELFQWYIYGVYGFVKSVESAVYHKYYDGVMREKKYIEIIRRQNIIILSYLPNTYRTYQ